MTNDTFKGMTVNEVLAIDPAGTAYTFVDRDGVATHIASQVLRTVIESWNFPVISATLHGSLIRALERGELGVEEEHALTLPDSALETPITVCEWGPSHVIADGAHRLWRRWKRGDKDFKAYLVPENLWRAFVILDMPGNGAFWDMFNRTAKVRTPELEALAAKLRSGEVKL